MRAITIDPAVASSLGELSSETLLVDNNGRVLGYYVPQRSRRLPGEPDISDAELAADPERRGGRPLADILRDLGAQ